MAIHISASVGVAPIDLGLNAHKTQATPGSETESYALVRTRLEHMSKAVLGARAHTLDVVNAFMVEIKDTHTHHGMPASMLLARHQAAHRDVVAHGNALSPQLRTDGLPQLGTHQSSDQSHRDMFQDISDRIQDIQDSWVNQNQGALAKYLDFYQEFSRIMGGLGRAVSAGSDGKVTVDFRQMVDQLRTFLDQWGPDAMGTFRTRQDAVSFLTDAGLNPTDFPITQLPDGTWGLGMPEATVETIIDSMVLTKVNDIEFTSGEMSNARYQAWLSGKDSQVEQLQHNSQVLGERFSRVTQLYDNLVKVLSATIESITDVDKSFVSAL